MDKYSFSQKCFFILLILVSNTSFGQSEFYKVYGNSNTDYLTDLYKFNDNSFLITGFVYNSFSQGMFCSKLDLSGNIIWNKVYGTSYSKGQTIFELNDKIFIGGSNINNGGNAEIHCIDTLGNLIWGKEFDLGGNEDIVSISNINNELVLIGNTNAFGNMFDILFLKLDTNGNVILSKKIGTTFTDEPRRIIKCHDDSGFLIIGSSTNNNTDAFIIKINNNGNILWSNLYGGTDAEVLSDGIELEYGNFIFTGTSFSFGNISNDGDIWVLSTDSVGNILYSKNYGQYGTDRGNRIVKSKKNTFLITGETWSYGNAKNNAFVLKVNTNCEAISFETFGGDLFDYGLSILYNIDNTFTLSGYTTSFGFGSSDFFITKKALNNTSCFTDTFNVLNNNTNPYKIVYSVTDDLITIQENLLNQQLNGNFQVADTCNKLNTGNINILDNTISIYPNPTKNIIKLNVKDPNNPIIELICYDLLGQRLIQLRNLNISELNLENYSRGTYVIKLTTKSGQVITKKVIRD